MKNRIILLISALGLFVLAAGLGFQAWKTQRRGPAPEAVHALEREEAGTDERTASGASHEKSDGQEGGPPADGLEYFLARQPAKRPASLAGTEVDGGVRADAQGRLIVEARIRRMFEYFLSTLGEASLAEVKTWVAHYLDENLPASAAREGWSLFRNYLDYRRSLDAIAQPGPDADMDTMAAAMERRNALRREKLGRKAADAFFAAEEAYDEYMLRRRAIAQDDDLTEAEKQQQLEQARAELPEPMREVREETTRPIRAREKVEQMRAEGASEAEIRAWREANLGAEAADRLEKLEQRRKQWEERYQSYRRQREQLDTSGLAKPEREAALQRLREAHFEADEMRRVQALDRIRAQRGSERPDQ
jgi:lipase chaperone LimK